MSSLSIFVCIDSVRLHFRFLVVYIWSYDISTFDYSCLCLILFDMIDVFDSINVLREEQVSQLIAGSCGRQSRSQFSGTYICHVRHIVDIHGNGGSRRQREGNISKGYCKKLTFVNLLPDLGLDLRFPRTNQSCCQPGCVSTLGNRPIRTTMLSPFTNSTKCEYR
jgi:hypothetical protein